MLSSLHVLHFARLTSDASSFSDSPPFQHPLKEPLITTTMADKLRTLQNLEALQARYIGTGHADTTKYEWTSNILRDSYASYVGHNPLLSYMSVGMGEPKEKVRTMMLEKMVRGAGNPPEVCVMIHHQ